MNSRLAIVLTALMLVAAPIVGAVGPVGSAAAQPELDGMVGVPDANVQEDLPVGSNSSLRASDLEGSVMASSHADSLQVVVTTPDRATEYVNGSRVGGSGGVALVFQDDTNHAGREVAVPADAVRETVGYLPEVVHGVHESGDSWTSQVEARNGMLFFEIPMFSSNSVTFSGTTTITGRAAVDQSSYVYDVGSIDSVSEFNVSVTGNTSTESEVTSGTFADGQSLPIDVAGNSDPTDDTLTLTGRETTSAFSSSGSGSSTISVDGNQPARNVSVEFAGSESTNSRTIARSSVASGSSTSIDVGGNLEPSGPASGEPELTLTAATSGSTVSRNVVDYHGSGSTDEFDFRIGQDYQGDIQATAPETGTLESVAINMDVWHGTSSSTPPSVDVFVSKEGADSNQGEGTKVADWTPSASEGYQTVNFDDPVPVTKGETLSIEIVTVDPGDDYFSIGTDSSASSTWMWHSNWGAQSNYVDATLNVQPAATDVSVSSGSSVASLGTLVDGESATTGIDLSQSDSSLSVSGTNLASADLSVDLTERTATEDPSIDLDGDGSAEASTSGILTSGQTATASAPDGSLTSGSNSVTTSTAAGPTPSWTVSGDAITATEDPSVTVGGTTVAHTGVLGPGETVSQSVDLSLGSQSATVTTAGEVDVEASWTERTETTNPKVVVNGHETGGSTVGTLANGVTANLSTNTSWITDGTNDVTVRVGDGTLSGDAPPPMVDLDYRHDTAAEQTTEYSANGWVERYNVSRTFPSDQTNATLTIPHSSEVYEIRYVQLKVNGGSWTDVPSEDWTLDGTTLNVALDDGDGDGQIDAGDTIAVRTSAYKIQTVEGKVTVVDPTAPGDPTVETEIRVDDRRPGFHVRVDGTRRGGRVHYAHGESWDDDRDHVIVDATGEQELYLPNAEIGDTTQVTTIPLVPHLSSGDVEIRVARPDEPTISVAPGNADVGATVDYEFLNVDAGKTYGLRSASRSRYVDKADAGAESVTLTDDDSEETLVLEIPDESGGGGGGSAGGAPSLWQDTGTQTTLQEVGVVVGWVALVLLLVAATGRSSLSGRRRWLLVATVSVGSGLLSIEVLRPGMVSRSISSSLEQIIPLAGLAAIGLVIYSAYSWWQTRRKEASTPETKVTLDLGRGGD